MARRRYRRRNEGLLDLAVQSDWKVSAGLAATSVLGGAVLIPALFGSSPLLRTDDARAFAAENCIALLDGKPFLAMLQRLPQDAGKRLLAFATEGDWTTPTCASCGGRITARGGKRGPFWGWVTYPRCKVRLKMRDSARVIKGN